MEWLRANIGLMLGLLSLAAIVGAAKLLSYKVDQLMKWRDDETKQRDAHEREVIQRLSKIEGKLDGGKS